MFKEEFIKLCEKHNHIFAPKITKFIQENNIVLENIIMKYARYDKKYNTKIIRVTFLILNTMIDSNEIEYEYFNDYTGLSRSSYKEYLE